MAKPELIPDLCQPESGTSTSGRKSERRLQLLEAAVANANDAIIILEAEPGEMKGRKILYVNEAFTRMTGYSFEEATQTTLRILRGPKTDLRTIESIRIALEYRNPVRVEIMNYRKDGSEFWAECSIVPFADESGSFVHWVSVQRDITARKKAEEERENLLKKIATINADLTVLNHEIETIGAERTMSLMALTVADRIRNPVSMIGARCRRILNREQLSEQGRTGICQILEGAEKLEGIVDDFETFVKERQYQFKHDDLNRIVTSVVSVARKEASLKGIQVQVHIAAEPLRINMQWDLLRIAVFHVIRNAVEATPKDGIITVGTCRKDRDIVLSVSDTGCGISQEDIPNVFRTFFSTKEKGFGMGLPLVKQIVSEHLGRIDVKSSREQGTTFDLVFPENWQEGSLGRQ